MAFIMTFLLIAAIVIPFSLLEEKGRAQREQLLAKQREREATAQRKEEQKSAPEARPIKTTEDGLFSYRRVYSWGTQELRLFGDLVGTGAADYSQCPVGIVITRYYEENAKPGMPLRIPKEIDGVPVVGIGDSAFSYLSDSALDIPDPVWRIGDWAFAWSSLTKVSLPESLLCIGECAFYQSDLEEIDFPPKLRRIGASAFSGCSFTEAILPDTLRVLGQQAFEDCDKLRSVSLPGGIEAFWDDESTDTDPSIELGFLNDDDSREPCHTFRNCKELSRVELAFPWEIAETEGANPLSRPALRQMFGGTPWLSMQLSQEIKPFPAQKPYQKQQEEADAAISSSDRKPSATDRERFMKAAITRMDEILAIADPKARDEAWSAFWLRMDTQMTDEDGLYLITYEGCRRVQSRGTSVFHFLCGSKYAPFCACGWVDYGGYGPGVGFRINRKCFDGRSPELYYIDDGMLGEPGPREGWHMKYLENMVKIISDTSSGLCDVRLVQERENEPFSLFGRPQSPNDVTSIRFRLDENSIRESVPMSGQQIPTDKFGGYVFVLPRAGEFECELGEIVDGKRVPLHLDDFCMK